MSESILVDIYIHANRETNWDIGEAHGLQGNALKTFSFLGYEHKLTFLVDKLTGNGNLVAVDGRKLEELHDDSKR